MAAFAGDGGRVILVRNHELDAASGPAAGTAFGPTDARLARVDRDRLYDAGGPAPAYGGTTTLVLDADARRLERQFMSLGGTLRNCAGGPTPWGSWLSCEESLQRADDRHARDHGYVFEVPSRHVGLVAAQPLKALGRFNHEAAAIDPASGVVYMTEDQPEGLFYRFLPRERGRLAAGGRLQALAIESWPGADTRGWHAGAGRCEPGREYRTRWIDLAGVDTDEDDLRQRGHAAGAALFARAEGLWAGNGACWFACTIGGSAQAGQIFRHRPDAGGGSLMLFVESEDPARFAKADNLTVAPWGDLIVCEDARRACQLVGVRADGGLYVLARNSYNDSELAGVCFAPDGRTLFVTVQWSGLTLAISGPFETL